MNPLQTNPFRTIPHPRPDSQPNRLPAQVNPIGLHLLPQLQQQIAQAIGQQGPRDDGQPLDRTSEPPNQDTQAAPDGAHPPAPEAAPLPPLGLPNLPGNGDQAIRRDGITHNGARWTVTYNQIIPARLPQTVAPFTIPHALAFGRPPLPTGTLPMVNETQRLLPRIQRIFQETKREMDNIRALLQIPDEPGVQGGGFSVLNLPPSLSIPPWRIDRLRQHLNTVNQNLNVVDRALALLPTDPEVVALRRSATELRIDAVELNILLDRQQSGTAEGSPDTPLVASTTTPAVSTTSHPQVEHATQTIPADAPAELFLLSSPQGPVGVLFDQQGTYTTAPALPTLPFQTFSSQFAQNRQLIAGLGQQMGQGTNQLHNQIANMQPTPTAPPVADGQAQDQNRGRDQVQNQDQNENLNAPQPDENDRMANIAGHLWLIFKLAVFVYIFAGGGSIYRPLMLGAVAGIVYLAQIGMFEDHINFLRRHFEALLNIGAIAERAVQPTNQRPRGNMTPEEAARRILQQRQDQRFGWIRESMRGVERAFALFIASLFPGVGERMVHAQEERERQERVAAQEERQRQEEEARKRQEAAQAYQQQQQQQQSEEKSSEAKMETEGEPSSSGSLKGKERAEEPQTETLASAS